jgi:hypothetical protein
MMEKLFSAIDRKTSEAGARAEGRFRDFDKLNPQFGGERESEQGASGESNLIRIRPPQAE